MATKKELYVSLIIIVLIMLSCRSITPPFTCYESARIIPNVGEFTPMYSLITSYDDGFEFEAHHLGGQILAGDSWETNFLPMPLSAAGSIRLHCMIVNLDPVTANMYSIGGGFKFSPLPGIYAIGIGTDMGIYSDTVNGESDLWFIDVWDITMHFTAPVHRYFEFSFVPRLMTSVSTSTANYIAFNINATIGPNVKEEYFSVRPYAGYLLNLNGDNHRLALGIAVSLYMVK